MKIKLTPGYILSFFVLVFLIHELHDWAHYLIARAFCGCWGPRGFDSWAPCRECSASGRLLSLASGVGPLINYLAIWVGWKLMDAENTLEIKSLGFSLVFAALPLPRILAALSGGGDETTALRIAFQKPNGSNHYIVALTGLFFVLTFCLPALFRALLLLPEWKPKLLCLPPFLILPGLVDQMVVHHWLNGIELKYHPLGDYASGLPYTVIAWLVLLLLILLFSWKYLRTLFEHKDLPI